MSPKVSPIKNLYIPEKTEFSVNPAPHLRGLRGLHGGDILWYGVNNY